MEGQVIPSRNLCMRTCSDDRAVDLDLVVPVVWSRLVPANNPNPPYPNLFWGIFETHRSSETSVAILLTAGSNFQIAG